jgi:hypothetical protein
MGYHSTPIKPDDPSLEKYFYVCQTRGCGAVINPDYPVGLKDPSPARCKLCQDKATRVTIEECYDTFHQPKVAKQ